MWSVQLVLIAPNRPKDPYPSRNVNKRGKKP